jgi:hypothetical protein
MEQDAKPPSDEAVKDFKEIYRKEFNEEIDDAMARILATRLLNLYRAVYKPNFENDESREI